MIEAAIIAMTVMGCNHQSEDCKVIAQPPKVWQSQSACDAAIPKVIEGSLQAPYPVIVARCEAKASKTAEAKPAPRKVGTANPEVQIVELPAPTPGKTEPQGEDTKLPPIAKLAVQKTTEGWTLVRKGANDGLERLSDGVKGAVGGVKTVVDDAVDLAVDGAEAVRDVLLPEK